jgi:hypothetical protein
MSHPSQDRTPKNINTIYIRGGLYGFVIDVRGVYANVLEDMSSSTQEFLCN